MPTYDTTGPVDVEVDVGIGHVELTASERPEAVAQVGPSRPHRAGDVSLAGEATVTFEGGVLRVSVPRRLSLFGRSDSVEVRVEVPTGSRASVVTGYGSVRMRGTWGGSRVVAKYGSLRADVVGALVLESPHGTVDIGEVTGDLDATVGHGQLRIGRVRGHTRMRGSHGPIDLGTAGGSVEVATSGPFTLDRALGDVTVRSAHGAIRVREVTGGSVRLENTHAEVEVGVPHGLAAWVDATSTHGSVRNELRPDPAASAADRAVELRLRSSSADVLIHRVHRAAPERAAHEPSPNEPPPNEGGPR